MAYKTILAHCNDKKRVGRTVGTAVELAERFGAHLDAARREGCDLIVMAPHGRRGLTEPLARQRDSQGPGPQRDTGARLPTALNAVARLCQPQDYPRRPEP